MKKILHFYLFIVLLFSGVNSFAEKAITCPSATISYSSNSFCVSESNLQAVTLTGTGAYLGGTFDANTPGLVINPVTGEINPSISTPGYYYVIYTIQSDGTCPSFTTTTNITITAVNTVSSASSYPTVCVNTPLTAITHITTGATGIGASSGLPPGLTSSWSSNVITITGTPTIAGVFNYTIPLTGGCGTAYTTGTITVTMASNAGNPINLAVCDNSNSPIDLYSLISGEQPGGTWTRTSGVGGAFDSAAGLFTPNIGTTTSSFVYTVVGNAPCGNASSTVYINVSSQPTNTSISGSTSICSGNTANLTVIGNPGAIVTITDGITPTTYTIGAGGTIIIPVIPSTTTTFTLTSANLNGCAVSLNQSVTVTVSPTPGTPIGLPTSNICSGEAVNLIIDSSPNISGTMLEWTVIDSYNVTGFTNGIGMSPIYINDVLYNTSYTQGFVKYSVTSKLGNCDGGTTIYTVYVQPLPNPVLTDGSICVDAITGETYQGYVLDTQLFNPNFTYDWFMLNTTTNIYDQIAGASASTYEANVAGSYQVIVTNTFTNCISQSSANVIESFPATEISTIVSDSTITVTTNATGTSNLIYALDNGEWQQSNVFTGVESGTHTVAVSDIEGCTNLTIEVIINNVDRPDLVMYQNSLFDTLSFKNGTKVKTIQISNQMGQTVMIKEINLKTGTIDLSDLNYGIYNITFDTENGEVNQRIIKQ